jgi:polyphosphate kinase
VVYGVVGLKTHAKMLLVTRREGKALKRYAHLSTGNYNAKTARLYTDISYLTANTKLTADIEHLFIHLASQSRLPRMNHLWVAPFKLQDQMVLAIEKVGRAAAAGRPARIVAKMNALTDDRLARALVLASQQGAKVQLIVRGACILPAEVPGMTDNIQVRSVIGRFLEHSRVFYFRAGDDESLYLSSADWMNRNMLRRVELAWPVLDPVLRARVIEECLELYLNDNTDAWVLKSDATYARLQPPARQKKSSAQALLMARYAGKV